MCRCLSLGPRRWRRQLAVCLYPGSWRLLALCWLWRLLWRLLLLRRLCVSVPIKGLIELALQTRKTTPILKCKDINRSYRLRFGIETSYRQLNEARIKTTLRSPALRLLFVGIALVLRNVWVWVHWHRLATPRRGGRKLNLHKLRFKTLLMWLTHLAEQTFGINDCIVAERPG